MPGTLNEGRSLNPGDTTPRRTTCEWARASLNEGRSLNPGDTVTRGRAWATARPTLNEGRSLNPGDTDFLVSHGVRALNAQRRPESEPRRHRSAGRGGWTDSSPLNEGRSLNPGDTRIPDCATASRASTLNEGRSLNPGDTVTRGRAWATARPTLNEGRSLNPGDTDFLVSHGVRALNAQRRPGSEPRRHALMRYRLRTETPSGSTKAGV